MKIYKLAQIQPDKQTYRVPSTSQVGIYYSVDRLHTTADTFVYRCQCIGFMTRIGKDKNFECKHIKEVKIFEEREKGEEVNKQLPNVQP